MIQNYRTTLIRQLQRFVESFEYELQYTTIFKTQADLKLESCHTNNYYFTYFPYFIFFFTYLKIKTYSQ